MSTPIRASIKAEGEGWIDLYVGRVGGGPVLIEMRDDVMPVLLTPNQARTLARELSSMAHLAETAEKLGVQK